MIPVNIRKVRVGAFTNEVSSPLNYGNSVLFTGVGEVVRIVGKNNQDGTQDLDYVIKPRLTEIKKSETDISVPETISTEVQSKKSQSKQLRDMCFAIGSNIGLDPEKLYSDAIEAAREYVKSIEEDYLMKGLL